MSKKTADLDFAFTRRTAIAGAAGGLVWAGLIARLFQLQILDQERYQAQAEANHIKLQLAPPQRGRILDRFGRPLASHRRAGRISITPEQTDNPEHTLAQIAALIELPDERLERIANEIRLSRRRNAGFVPVTVAHELTYEDFARMNVHAAEMPGVNVEMALTRSYPRGRDFAHVLGYVAAVSEADLTDDPVLQLPGFRIGKRGIERRFDARLRGKAGNSQVEVNAFGRVIREIRRQDGQPGARLALTLDAGLQAFTTKRLVRERSAAAVGFGALLDDSFCRLGEDVHHRL